MQQDVPPGAARRLVRLIEAHIATARLLPGQLIGTQGHLCEQYGISPNVFFQATRVLTDRGRVELRPGSGGGLFVAEQSLSRCGQRLAKYLECIGLTFDDCVEVNRLLQEMCMRLATGKLSLSSVDRIRAIQREMATAPYYQRNYLMSQLSQEYAEGTGNLVLALLYRAITDLLIDYGVDEEDSSQLVPQVILVELSIAMSEAVIAGQHENAAAAYAQFRDALIRKQKLEAGQMSTGLRRHTAGSDPSRRALPDRVATQIVRDIAGMNDGDRLGREEELLVRYGVSRATFRQAIALLQDYGVVQTRRGQAGGLVVRTPDFAAIRESLLDVLHGRGATRDDATTVWQALAALALERSRTRHPAEVAAACQAAAAHAGGPQAGAALLMRRLFELAGLQVLVLFAELVDEFDLRLGGERPAPDAAQAVRLFGELERSLAQADENRAKAALRCCIACCGIALAPRQEERC